MNIFLKFVVVIIATLVAIISNFQTAFARGGGGHSLGFGLILSTSGQDDMNYLVDQANSTYGGITAKNLGSAYEFYAQYQYRFSGSIFALIFRPSYFTQSSTGSGCNGGDCKFALTGYTMMPLLRFYPLESNFLRLFMQAGVGYGSLSGSVNSGSDSLAFSGSNFGAIGGLGVDFCFTDEHCLTIEGNLRYLPIVRNISSSYSGSIPGITQAGSSQEVEANYVDLQTTMSGLQGVLAYTLNF